MVVEGAGRPSSSKCFIEERVHSFFIGLFQHGKTLSSETGCTVVGISQENGNLPCEPNHNHIIQASLSMYPLFVQCRCSLSGG